MKFSGGNGLYGLFWRGFGGQVKRHQWSVLLKIWAVRASILGGYNF
jgi:hypothetical protein